MKSAWKLDFLTLGQNHPDVSASYNNIGIIYQKKKDFEKALDYYNKSLHLSLIVFGENHPDPANAYHSLGCIYDEKGINDKALQYYEKSLKMARELLGDLHPNTIMMQNNLMDFLQEIILLELLLLHKKH